MPGVPPFAKSQWPAAVAAASVLTVMVLLLFRAPRPSPAAAPGPVMTAALGNGALDTLLKQEASLNDPTPLFLPTEWNSAPDLPQRELGGAFQGYPDELAFATDKLKLALPPPVAVPASPAEALVSGAPGNPLLGIGRTD
jgi:hypothetical protein